MTDKPIYYVLLYVMMEHDDKEPWKWAAFPAVHAIYETEAEANAVKADMMNPWQYWVKKCRWETPERLAKLGFPKEQK